ncbi:hypothetical protein [Nostoc sp. C117]|uniref:hypothetical protein n=1 Tax=Nostoc sp. C117 TaxID=3349875 RepID=UPI00370D020C
MSYFTEVYIIQSSSDYRKFTVSDTEGVMIPQRKLPSSFSAVFFHSSDEHILHDCHLTSNCIFEFNTPGTPQIKEGIFPILRQTAPNFAIKSKDIEEIFNYLIGQRENLPSICYQSQEILPALLLLCQSYISIYSQDTKVSRSSWWLKGLGGSKDAQQHYHYLEQLLNSEWITPRTNNVYKDAVDTLMKNIFKSPSFLFSEASITPQTVRSAYKVIGDKLDIQPTKLVTNSIQTPFTWIVAVKSSLVSTSVATALSTLLGIPQLFLEENEHWHKLKSLKQSICIIPENQIELLPKLRLKGFSGAVLVLSSIPFSTLKQQHRVLRFGQGSHDCCESPWMLSILLEKVKELVPLEPENFKFLHKELRASQKLSDKQITSCLEDIKHLKNLPQEDSQKIQEIEKTLQKLMSDARVACHTIVTIGQESRPLQQHFQVALDEISICDRQQRQKAINRLEEAFNHLKYLLGVG